MKAFLLSVAATVVLAGVAALILRAEQRPAYQAFATQSTRVGDPGENLVGKNWNGLNEGKNAVFYPPTDGAR